MKNLKETSIAKNFYEYMYNEKDFDIAEESVPKLINILFIGTSNVLSAFKSTERPTAFVFKEPGDNGEFIAGAVVQFIPNEDPTNPGNWNYFWTWDKDDIEKDFRIYSMANAETVSFFRSVAQNNYSMGFRNFDAINEVTKGLLRTISKWLDDNAVEGEERGVELDDVFQARVKVENGEKIKSLEVGGELKKLIKDDAAIEV